MRISLWALALFLISLQSVYALETVTLQLKWTHQFQFAGYYMAKAKGYYHDVGLDVKFMEGGFSVNPIEEVVNRRANFGIGSSNLLLTRNKGQPVVVLGVIFQHSPLVLLMRKNTPNQSIHDIVGKPVTIEPQADELLAYIKKEGVPLDSFTINHLNPELQDFIRGRTDAISAYSTDELYMLDRLNISYAVYSPRSAGIDFYGDNLFTIESEIQEKPERVKAFRAASLKGWQYAMDHIEETVALIHNDYAPYKTISHLKYEADAMQSLLLPHLIEVGYMFEGRWQHIAQMYTDLGMLPANISLNGFLYSPNPQPDYRLLTLFVTAMISMMIISVIALRFFRLNKKLDKLLYIRSQYVNLGEAMNNISHQWKQPLNELGIHMMLLEMLWEKEIPEKNGSEIKRILVKSHSILGFMAETIDIFRDFVSTNRQPSHFDPATLIHQTLHLVSENFAMEGIEITHDLERNAHVRGNSTEFSHVLLSILVNAKDVFHERNTTNSLIHIRLFQTQQHVFISISDNGGGIRIRPIRRIFNVGVSGKKNPESGLGLYISKKIIEEKMGGTIQAKNHKIGALFKIGLPIIDKNNERAN